MSQLKILTDNAADRATITVPSTAAGLGADRLKTDIKGEVCRVLSSGATITLAWPTAETIGAVVIPASNLGPSSTIRVRAHQLDAGVRNRCLHLGRVGIPADGDSRKWHEQRLAHALQMGGNRVARLGEVAAIWRAGVAEQQ